MSQPCGILSVKLLGAQPFLYRETWSLWVLRGGADPLFGSGGPALC